MSEEVEKTPTAARGPAYPYIPLRKAMDRVEQVHVGGLTKLEVNPISFYKSWGYNKESGNARQTMAALNHFGLVEYHGRGKNRKVKLSRLAQRIILDKMPDSVDRAKALAEAALNPAVYKDLFDKFEGRSVPEHAYETYLTLECDFSVDAAKRVISGFLDTFSYAALDDPDNMPEDEPEDEPAKPAFEFGLGVLPSKPGEQSSSGQKIKESVSKMQQPATPQSMAPRPTGSLPMTAETEMKIMLDGDFIRVSAVVDAKSAKKLIRALQANIALLSDEDDTTIN